ncbi:carbohydrate ABC transporter permease [Clostridium hydrogenum]|uniref:carbohydrate ABC transporter permease n=1 Tax=Clostridium hydrogenum TaxID=2855764 RepID=UPI001F241360|nr:sugar ABC transporter permease [Clostridium hydrogenum]
MVEVANSAKLAKEMNRKRVRNQRNWFFVFISPWLIGFLIFTFFPILFSFIISFTDWDMFSSLHFIGISNYAKLFAKDDVFVISLRNTFVYTFMMVPINMVLSLAMAYLLSFHLKGMKLFRTLYYLPAVVPGVASSLLFARILSTNGLLNKALAIFGIQGPSWLLSKTYVLPGFVFLALWGVGGTMILLLASINSVGEEMYESALLDGASRLRMFWSITIPQITPVIFFNLVTGIIGTMQTFTQVYMMTSGGPDNASSMIVPYLYKTAFTDFRMGYASSMAWVLFAIIMVFSLLILKSSSLWVFYEEEVR